MPVLYPMSYTPSTLEESKRCVTAASPAFMLQPHRLPDIFYYTHIAAYFSPNPHPLYSFTLSRRTDGRKAAWHSFLMVQLSGRGASSWFMVPTLYSAAPGARQLFQHQDQYCPTRGAKIGEGLQLQLPKSTQVPGHDPRQTTINHHRHHLYSFTFPRRWSSFSSLPALLFTRTHTDPKSPRQAKPGDPGAPSSTSRRSVLRSKKT